MFYKHHLFFCINQKEDPSKKCCHQANAKAHFEYMRERLQALELWGPGKIRASTSGCLGRCAAGPVLVIYPEAVWYTYGSFEDIDKILNQHLIGGQIVKELLLVC